MKDTIIISILVIFSTLATYAFINNHLPKAGYSFGSSQGYNFNKPTTTVHLPKILFEVSGLTDIDDHTLACVQDEDGIVFIYDWQKKEIKKQIKFGEAGDYEGITKIGKSIYILRSDGKLFEIDHFELDRFKVIEYDTGIPIKNSEGLAYDAANNCLLIAGKSKVKSDEYQDKKAVFAFQLATKKLEGKPVYIFSKEDNKEFLRKHKGDLSNNDMDLDLKIHPSGIAVHPITGKLFVLSSKDNLIYIFNQKNDIESIQSLDEKIHPQPEGITFMDNGDMFISNEGKEGRPSLLFYDYKNQ